MKVVGIVGQGYVGLPLSLVIARSGYSVIGLDNNVEMVENLKDGKSKLEGIDLSELVDLVRSKKYTPSTDFEQLSFCDVILICVPTPLDSLGKPDLSSLIKATVNIALYMKQSTLIIVESSIAPGTTREVVLKTILSNSKLLESDFYLAYSPERVDPTNTKWHIGNTPKIVAGINNESLLKASKFYQGFVEQVFECESVEVAEAAKILENSFRLLNITFINEFSDICRNLNIDVLRVIEAAKSKPFGFMPFYPSLGVGGHCIPVDPIYFSEMARKIGSPSEMIELSVKLNESRPKIFCDLIKKRFTRMMDLRILVVGISYKPNLSDVRESPAISLIHLLRNLGANVFWHDELVGAWNGESSVILSPNYDLIVLSTIHDYINLSILENAEILDTRGSV